VSSTWERDLYLSLLSVLPSTPGWPCSVVGSLAERRCDLHLAVFAAPFLDYILTGKKTVESRFSRVSCAPFERVRDGDVVALKHSGGPVVGAFRVARTWFIRAGSPETLDHVRRTFSAKLCATDRSFWEKRAESRYVTLMEIQDVVQLTPIACEKRDRRGWVRIMSQSHGGHPCRETQLSLFPAASVLERPLSHRL
jgi:hypothetical protein